MKTITVFLALAALALLGYVITRPAPAPIPPAPAMVEEVPKKPMLAPDNSAIIIGADRVLETTDPAIIAYLRDPKTGLCDKSNLTTTPTRKSFCTDTAMLAASTHFSSLTVSPTEDAIAFTLTTDELTPDTTVGIFFPKNTSFTTHLLTSYYLGNTFLSFSPDGARFAYQERCFEARCGITIKDTTTLATIKTLRTNETEPNYTFGSWIDSNTISYSIGTEVHEESF